MSIVQANLINHVSTPVTVDGGTSQGNAGAGNGEAQAPSAAEILATREMTAGDKAGAWIVTVIALGATAAFIFFLVVDDINEAREKFQSHSLRSSMSSGRSWPGT